MTLQSMLERYIRQEGLYDFLPINEADWNTTLSGRAGLVWLAALSLLSSLILVLFKKDWFLGIWIPLISISIGFIIEIIYVFIVTLIKEHRVRSAISSITGVLVLGSLLILGGLGVWIYVNSFFGALLYVIACLITLSLINQRNYYYFAQRIVQAVRRIVFTTSNAISVIPLALIALLLTLVSGNLMNTIANIELTRVAIVVCVLMLLFFAATSSPRKISKQLNIYTSTELIDKVFSISLIADAFSSNRISVEDKEDAIAVLRWRDIPRSLKLSEAQLESHINAWLSGTVILSSLVLVLSFAVVFFIIVVIISPDLVNFDNGVMIVFTDFDDFIPAIKVSVFLALIQMFAFWASLLDRSKESEFIRNVWGKVVDWVIVVTLYRALYCVDVEFWSFKSNSPFTKRKNIKIPEYIVIVRERKSREQIASICQKLNDLNPMSKAIRLEIFYDEKRKEVELETAFPDWVFNQPLSDNEPILNEIPQEDIHMWEQHLLGRNKLIKGELIPDYWFGDSEKTARLGREIWEGDVGHLLIMHPKVNVSDIGVFLEIRLFRKCENRNDYIELTEKYLNLARQHFPDKIAINVWLFYRFNNDEKVAELSWFNNLSDRYYYLSYMDEYLPKIKPRIIRYKQ